MIRFTKQHAFGLLAALVVLVTLTLALAFGHVLDGKALLWALTALSVAAGTTVTYEYPESGTTPPTQLQVESLSMVTAHISFGASDTTATVTHNMRLSATELAQLMPVPIFYDTASGTADPQISVALTDGNTVTFTKGATGAGTARELNVVILRPSTNIR